VKRDLTNKIWITIILTAVEDVDVDEDADLELEEEIQLLCSLLRLVVCISLLVSARSPVVF
jgi:hypothetical protein